LRRTIPPLPPDEPEKAHLDRELRAKNVLENEEEKTVMLKRRRFG
jgi:hypothetical protein